MKIYNKEHKDQIEKVICNQCGKQIAMRNGIILEGVFSGRVSWGYFSSKDGECQSFDLCESCYDQMTEHFLIPVTKESETEML